MKNKGGRPPKPPSERRSKWVMIRLTPGEHRKLQQYAKRQRVTMANLVRQLVLRQTGDGDESKERRTK